MEPKFFQLPVCVGDVTLRVARGHFATRHSHINYLIDVTAQTSCLREAEAVAEQLAERYLMETPVDTILCLDGTRVIGTCLARQLTQSGYCSINEGRDLYVLRAETDGDGKILIRDNARHMIQGKQVLILMASLTTGTTARRGMECVDFYGGRTAGVAAIYSHRPVMEEIPVVSLFDCTDLPDYASYTPDQCPCCRQGRPLDAVVNSFGYSVM